MHALEAISPIDGRYARHTQALSQHLSEKALMFYRLRTELEYLIMLTETQGVGIRRFSGEEITELTNLPFEFNLSEAQIIKDIETKGWGDFLKTNHDVKAVELYMRHKFRSSTLRDCLQWIHFALTSEDVNNFSYAMMLSGAVSELSKSLTEIRKWMEHWSMKYSNLPMLARTHGQPASPTTLGKEIRNYAERLGRQLNQLEEFQFLVKLNGATGNYDAHMAARPNVNWVRFSFDFVERFNRKYGYKFKLNLHTAQIEPHDNFSELFAILHRINVIFIDFCQDVWRYVSDDWLVQTPDPAEAGSSTMPNKVNPIDFENAEGNAGVANALFEFYMRTLPVSRLQRHLSDSTIIRTFGQSLGHCQISYRSLHSGLGKINADETKIARDLDARPEILAEAYQTILRAAGFPNAYEQMKELTRGRKVTLVDLQNFAAGLEVPSEVQRQLLSLSPHNYTGLASYLAANMGFGGFTS